MAACALAAGCYSLLLARADWLFNRDTALSVPAAVRLVPYNSSYVDRLASWKPDEREALLKRAVELNPFDFEALIQLGFQQEFTHHDSAAAERFYFEAFRVNHMFLPRWTLANFYFRQSRTEPFFYWARETLAITPYAPDPVFTLLWLTTQDAVRIATAIPERPRILLQYAWFLSNAQQTATIPAILNRLFRTTKARDAGIWGRDGLVADIEDRLVSSGDRKPALAIWSSMVGAKWIDEHIPTTAEPITDTQFRYAAYRHGFGWIAGEESCARAERQPSGGGLLLRFSGDQPDGCVVLRQYVPATPGVDYHCFWRASSPSGSDAPGLTWRVRGLTQLLSVAGQSQDLLSGQPSFDFTLPAGSDMAELSLVYARPLGSTRLNGSVLLSEVKASEQ